MGQRDEPLLWMERPGVYGGNHGAGQFYIVQVVLNTWRDCCPVNDDPPLQVHKSGAPLIAREAPGSKPISIGRDFSVTFSSSRVKRPLLRPGLRGQVSSTYGCEALIREMKDTTSLSVRISLTAESSRRCASLYSPLILR